MMAMYFGVLRKDATSDYGIDFPDFPGCVTAGLDLDDALRMAKEALALHINGMIEDGESVPTPTLLEVIQADPQNCGAEIVSIEMAVTG
ncbi:MAG: type II toxin-antitoxin system HicB family antitoxin [Colwellia sp.]|nr:type II toxin-antitoxin system HicB family antitoxin [Colwellia sp.]